MIPDSLVNHILRTLAEFSLLSFWRAWRWLAYEHEHSVIFWSLKDHQNVLKNYKKPFYWHKNLKKAKKCWLEHIFEHIFTFLFSHFFFELLTFCHVGRKI